MTERKTYESRWGHHPCDHDTYLKLKKLYKFYWQYLRDYAAWERWERKMPHNRVIRKNGLVVGPWPEPKYLYIPDWVVEEFQNARMPKPDAESVRLMTTATLNKIDELFQTVNEVDQAA